MRERYAALAGLVALALLAASLAPASTAGRLPPGADKLLHAGGYAVLAFLAARAVAVADGRAVAGVVLAVAAYGAGVELLQPLVGRRASALDALANLAGATAGAVAAWASRGR